jgi:small GTP-binding protein
MLVDSNEPRRVKILIIGNPGVGKSSVMLRYFKNVFEEEYLPTNGSNMAMRNFNYRKTKLEVEVLEIGGRCLSTLIPQTFHGSLFSSGAAGLVFCFDGSERASFTALEEWIEKTEQFLDVKGLVGILASNKNDLPREVNEDEAKNFARMKKLVDQF